MGLTVLVVTGDGVRRAMLLLVVLHHHLDLELCQSLSWQADTDVPSVIPTLTVSYRVRTE